MNSVDSLINISLEKNIESESKSEEINSFVLGFDIITIRILQKFYKNGMSFPNDTTCYYIQQLFTEITREGLKIELETLRKRLEYLVKIQLLEKVETYPRIYMPVKNVERVQKLIKNIQELLL